ncbi:interferon-induced transmembrane protein [Mycobacterium lentiflavum]|uniref:Interferon-induced transmembrane protein n=1 Tax=Mycobacterium lentiflavum TaxID=141349 RepID=A0A0E4GUU1_MYCLN|nr:CD225/dispanin family protein [Mycobacterium lentiflavum]CQD04103.1 interferon-induced transmembrane protein [Mycobacterium lentiflavum]
MSYPPGPYEGSPEWQGQPQQPDWQGQPQQPDWQGQPQQPGWQQPQQPGWPAQQPGAWPGQQEPDNYLVWAILCTVLCCLPFGIISLVYSNKVSGLWAQGRVAEAQEASSNAKKWAIIGAIAGGVTYAIIAILYIVIAVVAVSSIPSTTSTTFGGY